MKIAVSSICGAFEEECVGSKVTNHDDFLRSIYGAVEQHDPSADRQPGQHFIMLPGLEPLVSCGVGPRSSNPEDYVVRHRRGRCDAYLKREFATRATGCAAIVYTKDAYLGDPEVDVSEANRIRVERYTHIVVAVLAFGGPKSSPLTPYRFVSNLAGGNNEALLWSADEIRDRARDIIGYDQEWCVVSD